MPILKGIRSAERRRLPETLPRSANIYISSFLGFAPAENPRVLGICIIHNPQGVYYGGTIAAPVMRDIFENVLPYLKIEKQSATKETGDSQNS